MLNVDETFNMAQALCTSALEASYVNRLNVFFLINNKKPRHLVDVSADIIFWKGNATRAYSVRDMHR